MYTKYSVVLVSSLLLAGCATQPSVNNYINPKIKNQQLKQQKFEEDSLRCELFANNIVTTPHNTTYIDMSNDRSSGDIEVTDMYGNQYYGTYTSYGSGGYAKGLMAGSAAAEGMVNNLRAGMLRKKAWKYCMLRFGWLKKR